MPTKSIPLLCVALAAMMACRGTDSKLTAAPATMANATTQNPPCQRPSIVKQPWRHTSFGSLLSGQEHARHAASDVVIAAGDDFSVYATFSYGAARKDLEDEDIIPVVAKRTGCATTPMTAVRTDDDGAVHVPFSKRPVGVYPFFLMVPGDGSSADGTIYSIAPGTKAVLFDVDGTLTVDDGEMFEDLLGGTATAFADANTVANRWAAAGYLIVYTTGRPHFLRNYTRAWLTNNGFPVGPIFTVARLRQSIPTESGVGAFKTALIENLVKQGVVFQRAYGNAATDACAYIRAGIAAPDVYMTNNVSRQCDGVQTQPLPSYTEHLQGLSIPSR